jgi:selenocysteine-specific elongation factor
LAVAEGDLVEINQEMYLHRDDEARLRSLIGAALAGNEGLTVSEIREVLNTSRKYAVPLVEYLDRVGFTQRLGDKRKLVGN